ncbi:hypothetical protein M2167_005372 [Streptomyces sp. SPB4]|nr:hypothetical protein [Streptomyces sp. SPB4]
MATLSRSGPTFVVVRCLSCLGTSQAVDDGQDVSGIAAEGRAYVLAEHPCSDVARMLDVEPGRPAYGWNSHPQSPATWCNAPYHNDF